MPQAWTPACAAPARSSAACSCSASIRSPACTRAPASSSPRCFCARLRRGRASARRLAVSGAFHSPLMAGAADALRDALAAVEVRAPRFPVYSNGTAQPFADVRGELVANLLRPVRWRETVLALREAGAEDFVELGPGRVLTGLVKRTLRQVAA